MVSKWRKTASSIRRRSLGIRDTHTTPFATHLPVLAGLATMAPVTRVLELGSGPYSTRLFLEIAAFPHLEALRSFEDDPDWERVVRDAAGNDARLTLTLVDAVRTSVPRPLEGFDLIFIDDSRTFSERAQTITAVCEQSPSAPLVVIHDFEHREYRRASKPFKHRFVFDSFTPQVGVCWNDAVVDIRALEALRATITANNHLDPTDQAGWARVFEQTARSAS